MGCPCTLTWLTWLATLKSSCRPQPALNVISGDSHACNNLAMQGFMMLSKVSSCFLKCMGFGAVVSHNLKNIIKKKCGKDATSMDDEGGIAPNILLRINIC